MAPHLHPLSGQQRTGRLQPAGRVVVAGSDDDVEVRTSLRGLVQKLVVGRLCRCRWVAIVKDVARHEERVGLVRSQLREQPLQKVTMLGQSVVAMKEVADVPVAGGDEFHSFLFLRKR